MLKAPGQPLVADARGRGEETLEGKGVVVEGSKVTLGKIGVNVMSTGNQIGKDGAGWSEDFPCGKIWEDKNTTKDHHIPLVSTQHSVGIRLSWRQVLDAVSEARSRTSKWAICGFPHLLAGATGRLTWGSVMAISSQHLQEQQLCTSAL